MLRPQQKAFLSAYAECGNLSAASRASKVPRKCHYDWLDEPAYVEAFETAKTQACEYLETIAWEQATRAVNPNPTLLIFLMKGAMPHKYRENTTIQHTGANGAPLSIEVVFKKPDAG